jgi:hypothetical protein
MSDLFGTTSASSAPTTTYDRTGYESSSADTKGSARSPLGDVHVEEPRRHPLTYAALALSLLALILSIAALASGGDDVRRVRVGNNDCVSVAQDNGPAALYCRTGALPNG